MILVDPMTGAVGQPDPSTPSAAASLHRSENRLGSMSKSWRTEGTVEQFIDATPQEIYRVIADVTGTGERSAECRSCEWLPGVEQGTVGARFRGRNRSGLFRWSRVCEVVTADPGKVFAFRTVPERIDPTRKDSTTWTFTLTPHGSGTNVEHSYVITKLPGVPFKSLYGRAIPQHRDMRPQMADTLHSLCEQVGLKR